MRLTIHNARAGKDGVFSAKHNDRNFNPENSEHIDPERSKDNYYWHIYHSESPQMTFEDAEKRFYNETFTEALDAQNKRHKKGGHNKRIKTMDEYRKSKQACPEEVIYQVGKKGDTIDPILFRKIFIKQIKWEIKTYPNMKIVDLAIHNDEQGAPHAHVRRVWIAENDDGITVSQSKALEAMGIESPEAGKDKTRTNNPKKVITQLIRDHCIEVCESYGVEIEREPQDASKSGLDLITYKANQEKKKASKAKEEAEQAEISKNQALKDKKDAEDSKDLTLQETSDLKATNKNLKDENTELQLNNTTLLSENKELKDSNTRLTNSNARLKQISENLETKKDELLKLKNSELEEYQKLQGENSRLEEKNEKARLSIKSYNDKKAELTSLDDKIKAETGLLKDIIDDKVKASEVEPSFKKKLFNNNSNTKTYDSEMIEKLESLGENVETKYQNMINKNNELAIRENRVKGKEKVLKEREKGITEKSNNIDNIINAKVKEQVDIAINKVINPIKQTDKAERQEKFMKKIKAGKNKTVYDLYQEDLKKKINRDLAESFEQQKQQQSQRNKTWNDLEL